MSDRENCFQGRRVLIAAVVSAIALALGVGRSTSQTSEIDGYEAAVRSQSKAEALSFIKNFDSSHLVGDLIESLRPEVAEQVCADLRGSGPARARKACEGLREALAAQPDVPTAEIAPAAGGAVVDPIPTNADTSAGVSSDGGPGEVQDAGDTVKARGTDLSTVPAAGIAAVEPVSTSAATSASVPSDHQPQVAHAAGDPDNTSDADLFYIPVAAATPAGAIAVPASTSGVISTSAQSAEEPRAGHGTSDTDKSDDINIILPSMSISTFPASTGVPSGDEPDTSYAQSSSDQSSSVQSGSDKSDTGKNAEEKAAEEKAAKEAEKAAKEAEKATKEAAKEAEKAAKEAEKAAKEKGGKDKGGKGKGGKDKGSG
jgi:hypothetical protein